MIRPQTSELPNHNFLKAIRTLFDQEPRDALLLFAAAILQVVTKLVPDGECRATPAFLEHHQIMESKAGHILRAVHLINRFPEDSEMIVIRKHNAWRTDRFCLFGCAVVSIIFIIMIVGSAMLRWEFFTGVHLQQWNSRISRATTVHIRTNLQCKAASAVVSHYNCVWNARWQWAFWLFGIANNHLTHWRN